MKIYKEISLVDFEFWSGAENHCFKYIELKEIDNELNGCSPEGCSATEINDLFWFEEEYLCNLIGLDYDNEYSNR